MFIEIRLLLPCNAVFGSHGNTRSSEQETRRAVWSELSCRGGGPVRQQLHSFSTPGAATLEAPRSIGVDRHLPHGVQSIFILPIEQKQLEAPSLYIFPSPSFQLTFFFTSLLLSSRLLRRLRILLVCQAITSQSLIISAVTLRPASPRFSCRALPRRTFYTNM